MKTAFAFIFSLCCVFATAQDFEYNKYGEIKTSILKSYNVFSNPVFLEDKEVKEHIITRLGEGMYYEILNHGQLSAYPAELKKNEYSDAFKEALSKYKMYFVMGFKYASEKGILRVPYEENKHLPASYLRDDKTDFSMVVSAEYGSLTDAVKLRWNTKNSPASYPESLYARNYKTSPGSAAPMPGDDEFNKGVSAEKKGEYKEAMTHYVVAAGKRHAQAMYNIGALHYNGTTGEEYDSKKILERTTNPGAALKKRYAEVMSWFKKAADNGADNAMLIIGMMYKEGKGVDTNFTEANAWIRKAADKGNAKAQELLRTL